MKSIKFSDNQFLCLIEDAIFYMDDTFSKISGDSIKGFEINLPESIDKILKNGWGELYPSLEIKNEKFIAIAGETSWGGTGFVALSNNNLNSFQWMIHLSSMNNTIDIRIKNEIVRVTTDLNYPHGIDFIIPIDRPENFKIEKPSAKQT